MAIKSTVAQIVIFLFANLIGAKPLYAKEQCASIEKAVSPFANLQSTKEKLCCGNSTEKGTGAVRGLYPEIDFKTCMGKISPPPKEEFILKVAGACVVNLLKEALTTIWNNISGILSVPAELWAARSQIWQLMTDSDARAEFAKRFISAIGKFVSDRVTSLGSCLNEQEKTQLFCKISGQVIGEFATPVAIGKLFMLVKNASKAGDLISEALSKSPKGKELLEGLDKANKKSDEAIAKIGQKENKPEGLKKSSDSASSRKGKVASERSQAAVDKVLTNKKHDGKSLEQVVHENALLSDTERVNALKQDFPHLTDKQVEGIVKDVHTVGANRVGSGVYQYTDAELIEKVKKMKELGIKEDDRRAILSLGYAGELQDEEKIFQALLQKENKIEKVDLTDTSKSVSVELEKSRDRLQEAKNDFDASQRDPEKRMRLRDEIARLEREDLAQKVEEFKKNDDESFSEMIARMDRKSSQARFESAPSGDMEYRSTAKIQFSDAKITQLKNSGKSDFEISIAQSDLTAGSKVYFKDGPVGMRTARLKSLDPDNPDHWLLEISNDEAKGGSKTISVKQTDVAVSDKDFIKLSQQRPSLNNKSGPDSEFEGLIQGTYRPPEAEWARQKTDELARIAVEKGKGADEIAVKENQIRTLKEQIGHGAEFDSRVMKIQGEIDSIKYQSAPLNEYEISRFKALKEIPLNATEFSAQEGALIRDLETIKSQKKWFSDADKEYFDKLEKIKNRPIENRKLQLANASREASRLNIGTSSYSHTNASVRDQVGLFEKEMNGNFRKYDGAFSRLFKTSPADIYYAPESLENDFKIAQSFYSEFSRKAEKGPGTQFMLERVKLYIDSYQNRMWMERQQK